MLSASDLAAMQIVQETYMADTCVILTRGETAVNSYGIPEVRYVEGDSTPCGFNPKATRNVMMGTELVVTDAEFRLPIDTDIVAHDRIKLTHRYGNELVTAQVYDVVGEPITGPSALVVRVRLSTK